MRKIRREMLSPNDIQVAILSRLQLEWRETTRIEAIKRHKAGKGSKGRGDMATSPWARRAAREEQGGGRPFRQVRVKAKMKVRKATPVRSIPIALVCPLCSTTFKPACSKSHQRYCSKQCTQRAWLIANPRPSRRKSGGGK